MGLYLFYLITYENVLNFAYKFYYYFLFESSYLFT